MTAHDFLTLSRAIIGCAWLAATIKIWQHRTSPHANHAFAGSLAMVLSQAILVLAPEVPLEIVVFFIAMAQVTLATSFLRFIDQFEDLPNLIKKSKVAQMATFGVALACINNLFLML